MTYIHLELQEPVLLIYVGLQTSTNGSKIMKTQFQSVVEETYAVPASSFVISVQYMFCSSIV